VRTARPDVIVVGAGPAGAASAILLAEHGLHVLVLERGARPRAKICGEYLSPEAGRVLDRLGVLKTVETNGAVALAGMRITAPDGTTLTGRYQTVGAFRPYRQHAIGVSRAVLDGALGDRLRALPIDVRDDLRVTDVLVEEGSVVGVEAIDRGGFARAFHARLVVAADGRASTVAQRLGCRRPHRLSRMALVTYVSGVADCRDLGEIFVDPPDYGILNPLAPDHINASLVVPLADAAPWSDRLEDFFVARVKQLPHLARRLAGARREAPVQAMGPLAYRVSAPRERGVLLVGDAAGFYDPFTGEGIYTALRGAELAAEAIVRAVRAGDAPAGAPAAYRRARHAVFAEKEWVTRALQLLIARRRLANAAAHWLARRPAALAALLGVIGDFVPPRALARALRSPA
jgi:flavin-dependent dehydrogenase